MLNLLGQLGTAFSGVDPSMLLPPPGSSPGFAGGHFGGFGRGPLEQFVSPIDQMGGVNQVLAQNSELARQQQAIERPKKRGGGIGNFLGRLGDALLIANGVEPMYEPRQRQKRMGEALSQMFGDNPMLAQIMRDDPETGLEIVKMMKPGKEPEEITLMRMVGIDPASAEGRAIISRKLSGATGGSDPTFVRELEALGIDPHSPEALELYYGRNSPAGYLLKPKARPTAPAASGGPSVGQVVNGFRFKGGNLNDQANWEPVNGGPTQPASANFP